MPKFVVGLDRDEFSILADYFDSMEGNIPMAESMEDSIIWGIVRQIVSDYDDREPEYIYE